MQKARGRRTGFCSSLLLSTPFCTSAIRAEAAPFSTMAAECRAQRPQPPPPHDRAPRAAHPDLALLPFLSDTFIDSLTAAQARLWAALVMPNAVSSTIRKNCDVKEREKIYSEVPARPQAWRYAALHRYVVHFCVNLRVLFFSMLDWASPCAPTFLPCCLLIENDCLCNLRFSVPVNQTLGI